MLPEFVLQGLLSAATGVLVAVSTAALSVHRENERWLRDNIHEPLYEELKSVLAGELPRENGGYKSMWAKLNYYKTYRVSRDLKRGLDGYTSDLAELTETERPEDVERFGEAISDATFRNDVPVIELPSGRALDLSDWLRRNMLVLSCSPRVRERVFGMEPTELDYLWPEMDGFNLQDARTEPFDTERALRALSVEYNWGYAGLYDNWRDDWLAVLEDAFVVASAAEGSMIQETLVARQAVGATAARVKEKIEARTEQGLVLSLWTAWRDDLNNDW
jgi:hypothetical protein